MLTCDKSMSSDMNAAPPSLYTNSAEVSNSSQSVTSQKKVYLTLFARWGVAFHTRGLTTYRNAWNQRL